jgi:hypothetical protein
LSNNPIYGTCWEYADNNELLVIERQRFDDHEEVENIKSKRLFRFGSEDKEVGNFGKEWAEKTGVKIGVKYSLTLTGGTPALIAALVGMVVDPGDEVIVLGGYNKCLIYWNHLNPKSRIGDLLMN